MNFKEKKYADLVELRKNCRACAEMTNPSMVNGGTFDHGEIGPWSTWQGNLDAPLMVVGQDWGTPEVFKRYKGLEPYGPGTNQTLVEILNEIGFPVEPPKDEVTKGVLFFTNAILCLKPGNDLQAPVYRRWFSNCVPKFLLPLIDIVKPRAVATLGREAFTALATVMDLPANDFRAAVDRQEGFELPGGVRLFPMYHTARRVMNTHRSREQQLSDWRRVGTYLEISHGNGERKKSETSRHAAVESPAPRRRRVVTESRIKKDEKAAPAFGKSQKYGLFVEESRTFKELLVGMDPEANLHSAGNYKPEEPGNWFLGFNPSYWGKETKKHRCGVGMGFAFQTFSNPESGIYEIIRLRAGTQRPFKPELRESLYEECSSRMKEAGIRLPGFQIWPQTGKTHLIVSKDFILEKGVAQDVFALYRTLPGFIQLVGEVLREYDEKGAFEREIRFPQA